MSCRELAFVRGVRDAAHGGPCPYKRETVEWFAWLEGFSAYFAPQVTL
jgi:hypothetical protein